MNGLGQANIHKRACVQQPDKGVKNEAIKPVTTFLPSPYTRTYIRVNRWEIQVAVPHYNTNTWKRTAPTTAVRPVTREEAPAVTGVMGA